MRYLVLLATLACGAQRFNTVDAVGQLAFGVTMYADYSQTVDIARDGYESNPIIGRWGENVPPGVYFASTFILHTMVSVLIPRPWRGIWQGSWTVIEGVTVWNNWAAGYAP